VTPYLGRRGDNWATEDAKTGLLQPGDRGLHDPPSLRILQPNRQNNAWNHRLKEMARTGQAEMGQCCKVHSVVKSGFI
jgi:hypothetical protein